MAHSTRGVTPTNGLRQSLVRHSAFCGGAIGATTALRPDRVGPGGTSRRREFGYGIGFRVATAGSGTADFNADGSINCADVDSLVAEIAAGSNSASFDLTGDGLVNIADLDQWRVQGGAANLPSGNPYLEGDANLDGAVDGSDFSIWSTHKFTNVAAWCSGDFNASGSVDGSDFSIWSSNKFTTSATASAVPEPAARGAG